MSSCVEFQPQIMFKTLDSDPTTPNKDLYHTHTTKSLNHDNIKNCLLVSDEGMF